MFLSWKTIWIKRNSRDDILRKSSKPSFVVTFSLRQFSGCYNREILVCIIHIYILIINVEEVFKIHSQHLGFKYMVSRKVLRKTLIDYLKHAINSKINIFSAGEIHWFCGHWWKIIRLKSLPFALLSSLSSLDFFSLLFSSCPWTILLSVIIHFDYPLQCRLLPQLSHSSPLSPRYTPLMTAYNLVSEIQQLQMTQHPSLHTPPHTTPAPSSIYLTSGKETLQPSKLKNSYDQNSSLSFKKNHIFGYQLFYSNSKTSSILFPLLHPPRPLHLFITH